MNKKEIALILAILFLSLILFLFNSISKTYGDSVVIYLEGEEYSVLPLNKNNDVSVNSEITVTISDNTAYVSFSDCPDKLCQKQGKISHQGKTIVCLPNKVSVKIEKRHSN